MEIDDYTFKEGFMKNYFKPTVCGVGVVGSEPTKYHNKIIDSYTRWSNMIKRCYSTAYLKRRPSYKGCKVCNEWLYYPNFKEWYNKNYYEINEKVMELDKDIIKKGNKVYNPDCCIFVPSDINGLFTKSKAIRGRYLIGVKLDKRTGRYEARCKNNGELVNLGSFSSETKAFDAYKQYKEQLIKGIANEYRNKIPTRLYEAMINYQVEITD